MGEICNPVVKFLVPLTGYFVVGLSYRIASIAQNFVRYMQCPGAGAEETKLNCLLEPELKLRFSAPEAESMR
jgi:hypothetical protein